MSDDIYKLLTKNKWNDSDIENILNSDEFAEIMYEHTLDGIIAIDKLESSPINDTRIDFSKLKEISLDEFINSIIVPIHLSEILIEQGGIKAKASHPINDYANMYIYPHLKLIDFVGLVKSTNEINSIDIIYVISRYGSFLQTSKASISSSVFTKLYKGDILLNRVNLLEKTKDKSSQLLNTINTAKTNIEEIGLSDTEFKLFIKRFKNYVNSLWDSDMDFNIKLITLVTFITYVNNEQLFSDNGINDIIEKFKADQHLLVLKTSALLFFNSGFCLFKNTPLSTEVKGQSYFSITLLEKQKKELTQKLEDMGIDSNI